MTFSRKVFGKSKMSQWEYIFGHCIPTGFQSMRRAFINWMDLVWFEDNQKDYALLPNDDPLEQCSLYFWDELQGDVIEKEFLDYLYVLKDQVDRGEVELVPYTKEMFDELTELVDDINKKTT
jgi:hypothetical protein